MFITLTIRFIFIFLIILIFFAILVDQVKIEVPCYTDSVTHIFTLVSPF